jgi:hypothetical protein
MTGKAGSLVHTALPGYFHLRGVNLLLVLYTNLLPLARMRIEPAAEPDTPDACFSSCAYAIGWTYASELKVILVRNHAMMCAIKSCMGS